MFWFIIFGIKDFEKKTGSGTFPCPYCKTDAPYRKYKIWRFLALYFIPIIPLGSRGEFVCCSQCGVKYPADVLLQHCPP